MSLMHSSCSTGWQCRRAEWIITHEEARLGSLGSGTYESIISARPPGLEWLRSICWRLRLMTSFAENRHYGIIVCSQAISRQSFPGSLER